MRGLYENEHTSTCNVCVQRLFYTRMQHRQAATAWVRPERGVDKFLRKMTHMTVLLKSLQSAERYAEYFFLSLSSEQTRFTAHCLWKSHLHADTGLKLWPNEPLQQMTDRSCCLQWRQRHHIYVSTSQETEIKFDSTLKVQINNSVAPCDLFCAGLLLLFFHFTRFCIGNSSSKTLTQYVFVFL